jgi:hypothetical protein
MTDGYVLTFDQVLKICPHFCMPLRRWNFENFAHVIYKRGSFFMTSGSARKRRFISYLVETEQIQT